MMTNSNVTKYKKGISDASGSSFIIGYKNDKKIKLFVWNKLSGQWIDLSEFRDTLIPFIREVANLSEDEVFTELL